MTSSVRAMASELRQSARRLFSNRGFAALVIAILSVGIGVNTAMFAVVDALLFRPPFQVSEPANVVGVQFRIPSASSALVARTHYPTFTELRNSGVFEAFAAHASASVSVGFGEHASLANGLLVSSDFFRVLRPQPLIGQFPTTLGTESDAGTWAVISYAFWRRHFGGAWEAVGSRLTIDGRIYSVVAIAPNGLPNLGSKPIDVWLPLDHTSADGSQSWRENRDRSWLYLIARVRADEIRRVVEEKATSVLRRANASMGSTDRALDVVTTSIIPGRDDSDSLENKVSFWLAGVSAALLAIAGANLSGLVLTNAISRRHEYFIRRALGASRLDMVRRHIADTCLIVGLGAAGALVVSFLFRNTVAGFFAEDIPISRSLWDARTTGILIGASGLTFILVSIATLLGSRTPTSDVSSANRASPANMRARRILLTVQASLCLTLVFIAGLFASSLRRVESLDLAVELDRTIQLTINLAPQHRLPGETEAIYQQAFDILTKHPDIERVALAERSPYMSGSGAGPFTAKRSFAELWSRRDEVAYRSVVGAEFFSAAGAKSLRGRDFVDGDRIGAPLVAIVNAPLAAYLWPSEDAIGQCMWLDKEPACIEVVGVVAGVWKFSALKRDRMAVYLPLAQAPKALPGALFIRPKGNARAFLAQARSIGQSVRPDLPAATAVVLRDLVDAEFRPWRLGTTVFSAFAVVALLITSVGLYGVVAANAASRMKEISIRMALGAPGLSIICVILAESLASISIGLLVGVLLVGLTSSRLSGVLFQTSPSDPSVSVLTALVLLLVSIIAVALPTRRGLRTNPADLLRHE